MIYGFDTTDRPAATGALIVYAIYRSRNTTRFRITPRVWGQVERFVKTAAKRAASLPDFIERLKPHLDCETINPRWMAVGATGEVALVAHRNSAGALEYIQPAAPEDMREFMVPILEGADTPEVLARLYRETAWIVLLVRDRLERERPIMERFNAEAEAEGPAAEEIAE